MEAAAAAAAGMRGSSSSNSEEKMQNGQESTTAIESSSSSTESSSPSMILQQRLEEHKIILCLMAVCLPKTTWGADLIRAVGIALGLPTASIQGAIPLLYTLPSRHGVQSQSQQQQKSMLEHAELYAECYRGALTSPVAGVTALVTLLVIFLRGQELAVIENELVLKRKLYTREKRERVELLEILRFDSRTSVLLRRMAYLLRIPLGALTALEEFALDEMQRQAALLQQQQQTQQQAQQQKTQQQQTPQQTQQQQQQKNPNNFWKNQNNNKGAAATTSNANTTTTTTTTTTTQGKMTPWMRAAKIGGVAAASGGLLFLTGGLMAPALVAGFTGLGLAGAATLVGSTTTISTLLGAGGAGFGAYKMSRRTRGVNLFSFQKINSNAAAAAAAYRGMTVYICVSGYLRHSGPALPKGTASTGTSTPTNEQQQQQQQQNQNQPPFGNHDSTTTTNTKEGDDTCDFILARHGARKDTATSPDFYGPWGAQPLTMFPHEVLDRFYSVVAPEKRKLVPHLLKRYVGQEEELLDELGRAYIIHPKSLAPLDAKQSFYTADDYPLAATCRALMRRGFAWLEAVLVHLAAGAPSEAAVATAIVQQQEAFLPPALQAAILDLFVKQWNDNNNNNNNTSVLEQEPPEVGGGMGYTDSSEDLLASTTMTTTTASQEFCISDESGMLQQDEAAALDQQTSADLAQEMDMIHLPPARKNSSSAPPQWQQQQQQSYVSGMPATLRKDSQEDFASVTGSAVSRTESSDSIANNSSHGSEKKDRCEVYWWRKSVARYGDQYTLIWEPYKLRALGRSFKNIIAEGLSRSIKKSLHLTALSGVMSAVALPLTILSYINSLDENWLVATEAANIAGRLLADALMSETHGNRPVVLIGYSVGGRVVAECLSELACIANGRKKHNTEEQEDCQYDDDDYENLTQKIENAKNISPSERARRIRAATIVRDAVILGAPCGTSPGRWMQRRSVVLGRLINVYSPNDWVLGLFYRYKSWKVTTLAGLQPVKLTSVLPTTPGITSSVASTAFSSAGAASNSNSSSNHGSGSMSLSTRNKEQAFFSDIENFNVADLVESHDDYPARMDAILQRIGIGDVDCEGFHPNYFLHSSCAE